MGRRRYRNKNKPILQKLSQDEEVFLNSTNFNLDDIRYILNNIDNELISIHKESDQTERLEYIYALLDYLIKRYSGHLLEDNIKFLLIMTTIEFTYCDNKQKKQEILRLTKEKLNINNNDNLYLIIAYGDLMNLLGDNLAIDYYSIVCSYDQEYLNNLAYLGIQVVLYKNNKSDENMNNILDNKYYLYDIYDDDIIGWKYRLINFIDWILALTNNMISKCNHIKIEKQNTDNKFEFEICKKYINKYLFLDNETLNTLAKKCSDAINDFIINNSIDNIDILYTKCTDIIYETTQSKNKYKINKKCERIINKYILNTFIEIVQEPIISPCELCKIFNCKYNKWIQENNIDIMIKNNLFCNI